MTYTPTFATTASFLGITRNDRAADFVVAGVPLDIGTTNRAGARDGPHAIRRASRVLTDGEHPELWVAPAALVHFDAHVDTWPTNFVQTYAHGSVFYHAIRERLVKPVHMIQIGIRSPVQRDVWDWTIDQGVTVLTAQDVHAIGPAAVAQRVHDVVRGAPLI